MPGFNLEVAKKTVSARIDDLIEQLQYWSDKAAIAIDRLNQEIEEANRKGVTVRRLLIIENIEKIISVCMEGFDINEAALKRNKNLLELLEQAENVSSEVVCNG